MDELDDNDKLTVARARKLQKFLSQPFAVAENFTGLKGKYVPLKDTVRSFAAIVDGEADDLPEWAFFNVGTLEDARQKAAEKLAEENRRRCVRRAGRAQPGAGGSAHGHHAL